MSSSEYDESSEAAASSSEELQEPNEEAISASQSASERSPRYKITSQCRKRAGSLCPRRPSKRYRLRGQCYDSYRELYNETVISATDPNPPAVDAKLPASQIGAVYWSAEEKETFFAALSRHGLSNLPAIIAAIGSKSMPEVQQYLLLLEDCHIDFLERKESARSGLDLKDVPAAVELKEDLCEMLELKAEALDWAQERHDQKREEKKHGRYWLLTPEIADELEDADPERDKKETSLGEPGTDLLDAVPAARLLRLGNFLLLSANVFMNAYPHPTAFPNWQSLADSDTYPSIYHTAFSDFHNLTVSLTRRLVQASIYQATSRLRAQGWRTNHTLQPYVRKQDVLAALDILGLKRNAHEYWTRCPRRCGIQIYDWQARHVKKNKTMKPMPYTDVEAALGYASSYTSDAPTPRRNTRSATPAPTHPRPLSTDSSPSSSIDTSNPANSPPSHPSTPRRPLSPSTLASREEESLNHHDALASQAESSRLRALFASPEPYPTHPTTDPPTIPPPHSLRATRRKPSPTTWRTWTEYRAEWEVFSSPVPEAEFVRNRRGFDDRAPTWVEEGMVNVGEEGSRGRGKDIPMRSARAHAARRVERGGFEEEEGSEIEEVVASVEDGADVGSMEENMDVDPQDEDTSDDAY